MPMRVKTFCSPSRRAKHNSTLYSYGRQDARVPQQPLARFYLDAQGAPAQALEFTSDISFMDSMWLTLANSGVTAHLQVLPIISTIHANRRDLARTSWRWRAGRTAGFSR